MLSTLLVVLLILAVAGGGFGHRRYGYAGWSPLGVLLVVILVLVLLGHVRL